MGSEMCIRDSICDELNRFIAEHFYRSDFSKTGNDEAVDLCGWVNEPIAVSDECLIVYFVADVPLS